MSKWKKHKGEGIYAQADYFEVERDEALDLLEKVKECAAAVQYIDAWHLADLGCDGVDTVVA